MKWSERLIRMEMAESIVGTHARFRNTTILTLDRQRVRPAYDAEIAGLFEWYESYGSSRLGRAIFSAWKIRGWRWEDGLRHMGIPVAPVLLGLLEAIELQRNTPSKVRIHDCWISTCFVLELLIICGIRSEVLSWASFAISTAVCLIRLSSRSVQVVCRDPSNNGLLTSEPEWFRDGHLC